MAKLYINGVEVLGDTYVRGFLDILRKSASPALTVKQAGAGPGIRLVGSTKILGDTTSYLDLNISKVELYGYYVINLNTAYGDVQLAPGPGFKIDAQKLIYNSTADNDGDVLHNDVLAWDGGAANGQKVRLRSVSELLTINAAATTDTAMDIPANVIIKAVTVRVTVLIPTAATFTVIGATTSTAFNTVAAAVAAGSTDKGNLNCPYNNAAAQKVRITPNLTPEDNTGRVRITIFYEDITPPTS